MEVSNEGKRRTTIILINIALIVLIIVVCFSTYFLSTKNLIRDKSLENQVAPFSANTVNDKTIKKMEQIFTEEDYPRVDGSISTLPLNIAFKRAFTGNKNVEIVHNTTHEAVIRLVNGDVDLILAGSLSNEEKNYARDKGVDLEYTPIVKEGLVFYTNHENSVENLTITQIRDIYSGRINNWKEVGGEDAEIIAFQRETNSSDQVVMQELVMKDTKIKEPETEEIIKDNGTLKNVVSEFDNSKYAIGYSFYYYAKTMYFDENAEDNFNIKFFKIDNVEAEPNTIKDGIYPLITNYYIITRNDLEEESNTKKLVTAMLSEDGQNIAEEAGYIKIK